MANVIPFESAEILLTALPVTVEHVLDERIGMYTRSQAELERYRRQALDGMVYKLSSAVLAETLVDKRITRSHVFEHKVLYPRSWWQHFKQDVLTKTFLTRWFVNWRPVKLDGDYKVETATLEVNLKQYAKFPSADLVLTPESIHYGLVVPHEEMYVRFNGKREW